MTAADVAAFQAAVRALHRAKSMAYRNAWKRRGETISVIANIARKVDRIESVAGGAPATQDESLMDTVVDLFVYVLKYQTFLADQDEALARDMFGHTRIEPPYSDGMEGFEALLAEADLSALGKPKNLTLADAAREVLDAFARIEAAFLEPVAPVLERAERASVLASAAVGLLAVLRRDARERYTDFLAQHS